MKKYCNVCNGVLDVFGDCDDCANEVKRQRGAKLSKMRSSKFKTDVTVAYRDYAYSECSIGIIATQIAKTLGEDRIAVLTVLKTLK